MGIRLLGTAQNPYVGMLPRFPQKACFIHGQSSIPGFEGGSPAWCYADYTIAGSDTLDNTIPLPNGFTLLALLGSSSQAAGFKVQIYDTDDQVNLLFLPGLNGAVMATGGGALWLRHPFPFVQDEPQCLVRVANLATVQAFVQIVLFGVVGGAPE